jgi:thiol-disulfide isomerase/thioredoxin
VEEGEVELRQRSQAARRWGIVLILGPALLAGCERRASGPAPVEPVLAAADLEAVQARLAPGGGMRVVNVWATWCQPCVDELPEFVALHAAQLHQGIQVIGISMDLAVPGDPTTIEARVRDFLRNRGIGFENLLYTGNVHSLLEAFDLPGSIPCTLVIGDGGEILWRHEGRTTRDQVEAALSAHGDDHAR